MSDNTPWLGANRRIGREDEEAYNSAAIFALQEPLPNTWIHNTDFIEIWSYFKQHVWRILLEIDIDLDRDHVYILDRGHMEGFLYEEKEGIPEKYLHGSRLESERAYMQSKKSLKEYLNSDSWYSLPEVIITGHVPIGKIKISAQQPLLEADLTKYSEKIRKILIDKIEKIPELEIWYKKVG